ncbi:MAG: Crp/Fnr family transcriptional regulator [Alcanivorax sp.]|nr:Crp/Fnr family transcriptional regulator [Alcanivorax sp.]
MTDIYRVLKACPLFAGFPQNALQEAAADIRVRQLTAGERIYQKGEPQSSLCLIASGTVRISSVNAEGREAVLMLFERGTWFGDAVFSPGAPRVYDATANESAEVLELPGEVFRELMARYPQSYPVILDLISQRLWSAISMIEEDALGDIESRIGRRLMFLVQMQHGGQVTDEPVTIRLTREHLANMMGMTRQGVHRVLKGLEHNGLLQLGYRQMVIPHPEALADYLDRQRSGG